MTFKITVVLRVSGRIDAPHVSELGTCLSRHGPHAVLDLEEVRLVDVAVVRFLLGCEMAGTELRNCSRYIREWMDRERREQGMNSLQEDS